MNDKFRYNLFGSLKMSQRKIALIIDSYQGNVCRTIRGKHLLSIIQIKNLMPYANLSIKDFVENTEAIRVGNGKCLLSDRSFIEKVFDMHINQGSLDF